jgi:hypothetical protein
MAACSNAMLARFLDIYPETRPWLPGDETLALHKTLGISKPHWLWDRDAGPTFLAFLAALVNVVLALRKASVRDSSVYVPALALLATIYAFVRAWRRDADAARDKSPRDLVGCLHVLRKLVIHRKGLADSQATSDAFRITIHAIDGQNYQQLVGYVGGAPDKTRMAGRVFAASIGVVGCVARTRDPLIMKSPKKDQTEFVADLVRNWGYSRGQAESLTPGRWTAMGVPIVHEDGSVIAVVYADSSADDWFSEEIQELMIAGTEGIASFIRVRLG